MQEWKSFFVCLCVINMNDYVACALNKGRSAVNPLQTAPFCFSSAAAVTQRAIQM